MRIEGVFLDIDDTLYPYPPCNEAGKDAAWREAQDRGYDLSREAFERFYMEGKREVERQLAGTGSAHERFMHYKRAIELHTGTHRSEDALALSEAYWDAFIDRIEPFPTMHTLLDALADRGLAVAMISDHTAHVQMRKVRELGVEDHVDLLVTSQETGRDKPSPVMFTMPLTELEMTRNEVIMVGNSLEADIAGANGVGITTILFNNTFDPDRHGGWEKPDHTVERLEEVLGIIDRSA